MQSTDLAHVNSEQLTSGSLVLLCKPTSPAALAPSFRPAYSMYHEGHVEMLFWPYGSNTC
jgi:hypothetical protein